MLDKKKHHFLQLAFIFGAITIISLMASWGYRNASDASKEMMGQSMGKMMQGMHLQNITIGDLIRQQESAEAASNTGMESHHAGSGNTGLETGHFMTTAVIVILLPFIIAGAVFLAIVWLK